MSALKEELISMALDSYRRGRDDCFDNLCESLSLMPATTVLTIPEIIELLKRAKEVEWPPKA